jgi:hypothetical protein
MALKYLRSFIWAEHGKELLAGRFKYITAAACMLFLEVLHSYVQNVYV